MFSDSLEYSSQRAFALEATVTDAQTASVGETIRIGYRVFLDWLSQALTIDTLYTRRVYDPRLSGEAAIDSNLEEFFVTVPKDGVGSSVDRVKNSFSDEVEVLPGSTESGGLVRPVFQDGQRGDVYEYVVVTPAQ